MKNIIKVKNSKDSKNKDAKAEECDFNINQTEMKVG